MIFKLKMISVQEGSYLYDFFVIGPYQAFLKS